MSSPYPWGKDPAKWVITHDGNEWVVLPPCGTFWGVRTRHDTFEDARADFKWQTTPVSFPKLVLGDIPDFDWTEWINCTCGEPESTGVVHSTSSPCFYDEVRAEGDWYYQCEN